MGLIRRVNDILTANLNDLLDGVEDPEAMLRQAVREMETLLARALDGAARVLASEKLLTRQLAAQRRETARCQDRAREAVARGDEDLARAALRRKRELGRLTAALEDQTEAAHAAGQRLRRQIAALRVRLQEAKRKQAALIARKRAAEARREFARQSVTSTDERAFQRFDRSAARIEQAEAETEAWLELVSGPDDLDAQGDIDIEVEAELERLKQGSFADH